MNRPGSPSTALRAPSPPLGEKDGMRGNGSWKAPFRFCARIGTMNQIGTPLPALSPQGGERVAEGRERGGSWKGSRSYGRGPFERFAPIPQAYTNGKFEPDGAEPYPNL